MVTQQVVEHPSYNPTVNDYSPSTTIYGSYRTLVLEDENSSFTFGDVTSELFLCN